MRFPSVRKYFSTPKVLLYIVLFAALLRFLGIFDELGQDEIRSFFLISGLNSPLEIITKLFDDNNHPLNSLFMYFIGKGNPAYWFKFRLLSLLAGTLTVPLTYLIAVKMFPSKAWRLITAFFVAGSFPLIFYSTEARGYALVAFFSLLSFYLLSELFEKKNIGLLLVFYCSFILGFSSSFSFGYIAFGLISTYIWLQFHQQGASGFGQKILSLLKVFTCPVILAIILYLKFVSNLSVEGTTIHVSLLEPIKEVAAYLVGFPRDNVCSYGIVILVYFLLFIEMFCLLKEASAFGIFCISSTFGICSYLLLTHPPFVFFRYFLCFYPFLIILFSHFLYRLTVKFKEWRLVLAAIVLLILLGNIVSYFNFIKFGRSHYLEALDYMHQHNRAPSITVAGDQDFQIVIPLKFYSFFRPDFKINYMSIDQGKNHPPEWIIFHNIKRDFYSPHLIEVYQGVRYAFEGSLLYCQEWGLAGTNLALYHIVVKNSENNRNSLYTSSKDVGFLYRLSQ